ncbi:MAG: S-layer protein, partial [Nanoarchaeota archaeon]
SNKLTEELWLTNNSVFYYDKDLKKKTFAGNVTGGVAFAQIINEDTKSTNLLLNRTNTWAEGAGGATNITHWQLSIEALGDTTDDLAANRDTVYTYWTASATNAGTITQLGVTKSSEEAGEVQWEGTNIGTKDENHKTRYGVVIKDPKSSGASDRVEFMIPADQVQANVVVKGLSVVGSATGTSTGNAIATYDIAPSGMLDTQVTTPANYNLILVGGPAVNRLSAQFLGVTYPAYGEASGLKTGEAILSLKANGEKVALIVAGWAGEDTQRAATVLKNYEAYKGKLTGTEVKVSGTTASPTIVTA